MVLSGSFRLTTILWPWSWYVLLRYIQSLLPSLPSSSVHRAPSHSLLQHRRRRTLAWRRMRRSQSQSLKTTSPRTIRAQRLPRCISRSCGTTHRMTSPKCSMTGPHPRGFATDVNSLGRENDDRIFYHVFEICGPIKPRPSHVT